MEKSDLLRREDNVNIKILGPGDEILYDFTGSGFHNLESAVSTAVERAGLKVNPEDCVFEVTNEAEGVSHKYRINAHGNLKLIV